MMEKFHYTLPDGHKLTLPRFENIPVGHIRKTRRLEQADQVFTLLELMIPEADMEHVDLLDKEQFNEFVKAWREGSDIDLGESTASTSS